MTAANDQPTGIVGGRPWPRPAPTWRRYPPTGYAISLIFAFWGISALTIGLGGELRYRAGLVVADAIKYEGTAVFTFCLTWRYTIRLIFWNKVPTRYQNFVRAILSIFLATGLPLAFITVFLLLTQAKAQSDGQSADTTLITIFTIVGVLFQIGTVIWLLRYRKE